MLDVRAGQHEALRLAATAKRFGLMRGAVTGRVIRRRMEAIGTRTSKRLQALNARIARAAEQTTRGAPVPEERRAKHPDAPVRLSVFCGFEASLSLDAMCDARDILYLQALQPTLHDEGSKPVSAEEREVGRGNLRWIAGAKAGHPLLREEGKKLLERGVHWLDASMLFADVEQTLYIDVCHYNDEGSMMFAQVIADELLRLLKER